MVDAESMVSMIETLEMDGHGLDDKDKLEFCEASVACATLFSESTWTRLCNICGIILASFVTFFQ